MTVLILERNFEHMFKNLDSIILKFHNFKDFAFEVV